MLKKMMLGLLVVSVLAGLCHAQATVPVSTTQAAQADEKVIAEVLGKKITLKEQGRLDGLILMPLYEHYVKEHGLEPTEAELESFVKFGDVMADRRIASNEKKKKELLVALDTDTLSDDERAQNKEHLKVVEWLLAHDKKRKEEEAAFNRQANDEQRKERLEVQHQSKLKAAQMFVRNWKLAQSLYQTYGGRVAAQKFGPVPIDAYMSFVIEEKRKGHFAIFDPELEKAFWIRLSENLMEKLVVDKEACDKLMSQPWWTKDEPVEP